MADKDLVYVACDPDALWATAIDLYMENGGSILYPGDEKEMLLRTFVAMMAQGLAAANEGIKMRTLRFSVEEYLDVVGESAFCDRILAKAATGEATIRFNQSGVNKTIPAGEQMTADGVKYYKTKADIVQTGFAQTVVAEIECTEYGSAGNGLTVGTEMQMAKNNPAIASIIVSGAAIGGNDTEDDETYRERIRTNGGSAVTTGTTIQYRADALAASSDVIDAKPVKNADSTVTVYLLLKEEADEESVITTVLNALNPENRRPLTDSVSAEIAEALSYTLKLSYTLPETATADVAQAVAACVGEYTDWQENRIARAFNPYYLVSAMYTAGATMVTIDADSTFDGGQAVYTAIAENQRCKGTVSITQL